MAAASPQTRGLYFKRKVQKEEGKCAPGSSPCISSSWLGRAALGEMACGSPAHTSRSARLLGSLTEGQVHLSQIIVVSTHPHRPHPQQHPALRARPPSLTLTPGTRTRKQMEVVTPRRRCLDHTGGAVGWKRAEVHQSIRPHALTRFTDGGFATRKAALSPPVLGTNRFRRGRECLILTSVGSSHQAVALRPSLTWLRTCADFALSHQRPWHQAQCGLSLEGTGCGTTKERSQASLGRYVTQKVSTFVPVSL